VAELQTESPQKHTPLSVTQRQWQCGTGTVRFGRKNLFFFLPPPAVEKNPPPVIVFESASQAPPKKKKKGKKKKKDLDAGT
jgi:hypothetical protein